MTTQNNQMYEMVKQFHQAFNHYVADKPTPLSEDVALNRSVWTGEELIELLYATANGDELKFAKMYYEFKRGLDKAFNKIFTEKKPVDDVLVAQMDALTDVEYFNQGSFVCAGVTPFELFEIVHNSNLSKLFPDGKPRYRESDGKIIKSELFIAPEPELEKEVNRQRQAVK